MKLALPKVQTIKTRNGKVTFHFDPAIVPSRNAKLSTRLAFAAAYLRRMIGGAPTGAPTLKLCIKWIDAAAEELEAR